MGLATIIKKTKRRERERRILVLGLDNSGKSTCVAAWLQHLHVESNENAPVHKIAPTFGFEIRTVRTPSANVTLWDVGGQRCLRAFWRTFFEDASDALVYVIDSQDVGRFQAAVGQMLEQLRSSHTLTVAIVANKQDLPGALTPQQLEESISTIAHDLFPRHVQWRLFCGSALAQPPSVCAAFDWLLDVLSINQ